MALLWRGLVLRRGLIAVVCTVGMLAAIPSVANGMRVSSVGIDQLTLRLSDLASGYRLAGQGPIGAEYVIETEIGGDRSGFTPSAFRSHGWTTTYERNFTNPSSRRRIVADISAFKSTSGAQWWYSGLARFATQPMAGGKAVSVPAVGQEYRGFTQLVPAANATDFVEIYRRNEYVVEIGLEGPGVTPAMVGALSRVVDQRIQAVGGNQPAHSVPPAPTNASLFAKVSFNAADLGRGFYVNDREATMSLYSIDYWHGSQASPDVVVGLDIYLRRGSAAHAQYETLLGQERKSTCTGSSCRAYRDPSVGDEATHFAEQDGSIGVEVFRRGSFDVRVVVDPTGRLSLANLSQFVDNKIQLFGCTQGLACH